MSVVLSILLTLLLLSILVFVHEFGHFIMAKLMGIRVLEFALFMGPKIFSFRIGETLYSLRCIPIGGFCSMEGEESSSNDERAFSNKPWYKRAAVCVAGPAMNIILAIVLSIVLFSVSGYSSLQVAEVIPDSPAAQAGIVAGDKIIAVDDSRVASDTELSVYEEMLPKENGMHVYTIKKTDGTKVKVAADSVVYAGIRTKVHSKTNEESGVFIGEIESDSLASKMGLSTDAEMIKINDAPVDNWTEYLYYSKIGERPLQYVFRNPDGTEVTVDTSNVSEEEPLGIMVYAVFQNDEMDHGLFTMLGDAFSYSFSVVRVTIKSFVWLFTGVASFDDVSGPVGMVSVVNDTVAAAPTFASGALTFLLMSILISISLGIFNLLPFPALDGGRLVIAFVEAITRKKVKPEVEGIISVVGFVILIAFSLLVLVKDIIKLF